MPFVPLTWWRETCRHEDCAVLLLIELLQEIRTPSLARMQGRILSETSTEFPSAFKRVCTYIK